MSSQRKGHQHQDDAPAGGPDDGAFDWYKVADIVIWVAIALVVALAAEWFTGLIVREKIAAGAQRMLAKSAPAGAGE